MLTFENDFAGESWPITIDVAGELNKMRGTPVGDSKFISEVLDIFCNLDFSNLKIYEFRIAECKRQMILLNHAFKFMTIDIAINFHKWVIENQDEIDPEISEEKLFENYIVDLGCKLKNENNGK